MIKKIVICYLIVITGFCFFSACQQRYPITVTFYDVSGAMSADHTIKILFAEEKDYNDYYVDIILTSNKDATLVLFQEFGEEKVTLEIEAEKEISLDEFMLFNLQTEQTESMVGYGDVLTTTIVINSNKDAKITLLAVIGKKEKDKFKKLRAISKQYQLNVMAKM